LQSRDYQVVNAKLRKPCVKIRVVKGTRVALLDHGFVYSRSHGRMMKPTRRPLSERATFTAVMSNMKDRGALSAGTVKEHGNPCNHLISLMRLERRHEQAPLNVDEE